MLVRLARVLGIEAGEGSPVAWLIVHSLFNGIFSALFLTAANALFLARFQIGMLPLAYIAASLFGYVAVWALSKLEGRVRFGVLLLINLGALLALASAFWIVRRFTDADWVVFLMFVAVGPMFNLIALGYWGLAGRLFDLRQGKRLFGLVGAGEEVSTIAGLFATPLIIRFVGGAGNLVPLGAIGLAGSFVTVVLITRRFRKELESGAGLTDTRAKTGMRFTDLLRVRYFVLMASSVVLLTLALYTIDFSFLAQVRLRFQGPGQIAQFFGIFYGSVKIVEFLMKVGVSGPLLNQFGLNVGLLVLPIVLAVSAGLGIVVGTLGLGDANFFVLVALAKLVAVSGRTSTFEPSFRVLYQPLGPSERIVYQSHVEGTARQLSVGVVGIALLLFSRNGTYNALALFYILVPILGLWIVAAILVHREYRVRLFEGLKGHAAPVRLRHPGDVATAFLQAHPSLDRDATAQLIERIETQPAAEVAATGPANPETRLLLVRQLAMPRNAAAAAAALCGIGPAILPDLERAFGQGDQPPAARRRIVNVIGAIGGAEAIALLADKLDSTDRTIRRRVIALLAAAGYRATPEQTPQLERIVEGLIRDMAWDMNVLVALQGDKHLDDVREVLESELAEARGWMFDLLSFLYDPAAVKGVDEILAGGSPQATVYALEILDLLLAPVLKPYVFAVVEGQSHLAVVRKLETLVPREHFTPHEALRALLRREYGRIGMWTRAVAVDRFGRVVDDVPADLVAFLFHPDPMIREVAAMRIAAKDRGAWDTHRKRLAFDVREALDAVVRVGDGDANADAHSIYGRTTLLGYVPGFAALAPEDRIALASTSELRVLQPGQRLPAPRDPQHTFFVTLTGEVELRDGDSTLRLTPLTIFTFVPGTPAVEATADALLIRLEPSLVFELAAEVPDIVPGLLQAVDARRRYAFHE